MTSPFYFRSWLSVAALLVFLAPSVASGQGIKPGATPVRTARDELGDFREAYAEAFNKKDSVTVANMYSPDAIVIQGDGSVQVGKDAIRKAIYADAPTWPQMTIKSDTVRVVGNTAWDVGTTSREGSEQVDHYLVVLRRGVKYWKINRLAVVPESRTANAADSAAH